MEVATWRVAAHISDLSTHVLMPGREARDRDRPMIETDRPAPGDLIADRYLIEAFVARGGMGEVYRARDLKLDVPLALKTIRPEIASHPASLRRFKQEVLLARSVTHPNVCRIFDIGEDVTRGVSFLTMEFLPGETLASRILTSGALPRSTCLPLVRQMADALDAAHRAGVVHRDFKSPNVMLVPSDHGERVVITDFGLAMTVARESGVNPAASSMPGLMKMSDLTTGWADAATQAIELSDSTPLADEQAHVIDRVGTPAYMSPEQVRGEPLGPASDLYAFGVVLFEMCTGQLPFRGATPIETARAHLTTPPPHPATLVALDETWAQTILTLLAKEPSKRYATAHDAVLALEGRGNGKAVARHSLPAERDAFVGRRQPLETLARHLEGDRSELVTLLGPGGTGKTRLAQKYGWTSLSHWPGGVWFCDLREARSVDGIALAVATALNVSLGREDPVVQLGHAIAGRGRTLVILDNFEQVASHAEATLGRWQARAEKASFLVTSRERLQLESEILLEVEPLDPDTESLELFEERARAHRPGFRITAENKGTVTQIVRLLEGLPLAIELAASRLRMLSLDQLRARLRDGFSVLSGPVRGRHGTLRATLDWSWALLTPWEQSAVAQASVFQGGFRLEAAEAVIDLSAHRDAPQVLDVIQSLVDKSWLRARVVEQTPRFLMYATLQEYASEKLRASGSGSVESQMGTEARHGNYFAAMGTEEAIEALDRRGGRDRRSELRVELDNLIAACRVSLAYGSEQIAGETYLALAAVLELRGPLDLSLDLGREVVPVTRDLPLRARVLRSLGSAYAAAGRHAEARLHYDAALDIYRRAHDPRAEAVVLGWLGIVQHQQGQVEEARTQSEVALALLRHAGDRCSEAMVLANLGGFHLDVGRMEEARSQLEAALPILREVGNRRALGIVLGNLGVLHVDQGRVGEARAHYEAALAIHREVGNRRHEGIVLSNLGALHLDQGRIAEAERHYAEALAIQRDVGDLRGEGMVLGNLAFAYEQEGRLEQAQEYYEAALAIHREVGNRRFEGVVLGNLGLALQKQGRIEEAREHYEAALVIHRAVGHQISEGVVLSELGNLHREQGQMEEACRCIEASIGILRRLNEPLELGKALCSLGAYERQRQNLPAARTALAEAESIATELALLPESDLAQRVEKLRRSVTDTPGPKSS